MKLNSKMRKVKCIQLQGPRTMPQPGSRPASSTPWHPHLERPPDLTKTIEIMKWVEAIPCLLAIHGSRWGVWTGSGKLIECCRVRVLYGCVLSPSPAGEGIMRWHYEDYAPELGKNWHGCVTENRLVPLNPMVLLIILPIKWLFHWEY